MALPLVASAIAAFIIWLVKKFLVKYCIKKLGKKTLVSMLRKFLIWAVKKYLPRCPEANRILRWLQDASDEQIGLLLEPEEAIFQGLTNLVKGKTNKLEINKGNNNAVYKDSYEGHGLNFDHLLGKDLKETQPRLLEEPYSPPPATQINRWGSDRGYNNNFNGNIFRY